MKVLIVDDEPGPAELYRMILKDLGAESVHVPSVRDALNQLPTMTADLVITDLANHPEDGFTMIQGVKNHDAQIPVMVISGSLTPARIQQAETLGASTCLPKPFDVEIFKERVVRLLGLAPG